MQTLQISSVSPFLQLKQSSDELRALYTEFIRRKGLLDILMKTLFHLMKINELTNERARDIIYGQLGSVDYANRSNELEDPELRQLALTSYYNVLCTMPAMVRTTFVILRGFSYFEHVTVLR